MLGKENLLEEIFPQLKLTSNVILEQFTDAESEKEFKTSESSKYKTGTILVCLLIVFINLMYIIFKAVYMQFWILLTYSLFTIIDIALFLAILRQSSTDKKSLALRISKYLFNLINCLVFIHIDLLYQETRFEGNFSRLLCVHALVMYAEYIYLVRKNSMILFYSVPISLLITVIIASLSTFQLELNVENQYSITLQKTCNNLIKYSDWMEAENEKIKESIYSSFNKTLNVLSNSSNLSILDLENIINDYFDSKYINNNTQIQVKSSSLSNLIKKLKNAIFELQFSGELDFSKVTTLDKLLPIDINTIFSSQDNSFNCFSYYYTDLIQTLYLFSTVFGVEVKPIFDYYKFRVEFFSLIYSPCLFYLICLLSTYRREIFVSKKQYEALMNYYNHLINNMHCQVVSFTDNKIMFCNKAFDNDFKKHLEVGKSIKEEFDNNEAKNNPILFTENSRPNKTKRTEMTKLVADNKIKISSINKNNVNSCNNSLEDNIKILNDFEKNKVDIINNLNNYLSNFVLYNSCQVNNFNINNIQCSSISNNENNLIEVIKNFQKEHNTIQINNKAITVNTANTHTHAAETEFLENENNNITNNTNMSSEFKLIGTFTYNKILFYNVYLRLIQNKESNYIIDLMLDNITEIKRAEMISYETKIKQKLFSKLAHEFKTPLMVIKSLVNDQLENKDSSNKELTSKYIYYISDYITFLINDIIYYSNNKEISIIKEEVDLIELMQFCEGVAQSLLAVMPGNKENIKLISKISQEVNNYFIISDKTRLKQVLLNFISNAVKFTKFGEIKIIASIDDNSISHSDLEYNPSLRLKVVDSGIGMNNKDLEKIKNNSDNILSINTDYAYNPMGTGLGLGIAKSIVEKLGFKLVVNSVLGKGSEFSIEINNPIRKNRVIMESFKSETTKSFINNSNMNFDDVSYFKENLNKNKDSDLNQNGKIILNEDNEMNNFPTNNLNKIGNNNAINNTNTVNREIKLPNQNNSIKLTFNELKEVTINNNYFEDERNFKYYSNTINLINSNQIKANPKIITNTNSLNSNYEKTNKNKILLVDDTSTIRVCMKKLLLSNKLISQNFEIIEANDGIEMLYLIIKDQSIGNSIKLIITDENMEYMSGSLAISLLRSLEQENKVKRVFIASLTAFSDEEMIKEICRKGADEVLHKPLSGSALEVFIQKNINTILV